MRSCLRVRRVLLGRALARARDRLDERRVQLDAHRRLLEHLGQLPVGVDTGGCEREQRAADEERGDLRRLAGQHGDGEVDVDRLEGDVGAREVGRRRDAQHQQLREEAHAAKEGVGEDFEKVDAVVDAAEE
eukprot:3541869-Prymnesium_polylepis.1